MTILGQIRTFFDSLETKKFYHYAGIFFASCLFINGIIVFYYYSATSSLLKEIKKNNNERSENIPTILQKAQELNIQRKLVDETISKDPNFKIQGYFKDLLATLQLTDKNHEPFRTTTNEREDDYREVELSAGFDTVNMKEVAELLQALEKNPRIATKRLEITHSKKKEKTIELSITITTLLPKTENV